MSAATCEAIEAAIRAHILDEADGAFLTDWALIAAAAMPDDPDATAYVVEGSDGPIHTRLGLVHYLHQRTRQHCLGDDE